MGNVLHIRNSKSKMSLRHRPKLEYPLTNEDYMLYSFREAIQVAMELNSECTVVDLWESGQWFPVIGRYSRLRDGISLAWALQFEWLDFAKRLIARNGVVFEGVIFKDIEFHSECLWCVPTIFHGIVEHNRLHLLQWLLSQPDPDILLSMGNDYLDTLLHTSCLSHASFEVFEVLFHRPEIHVSARFHKGSWSTLTHLVLECSEGAWRSWGVLKALEGSYEIARAKLCLLLRYPSLYDINATDCDKLTALTYATDRNDFETVRLLLSAGADPVSARARTPAIRELLQRHKAWTRRKRVFAWAKAVLEGRASATYMP